MYCVVVMVFVLAFIVTVIIIQKGEKNQEPRTNANAPGNFWWAQPQLMSSALAMWQQKKELSVLDNAIQETTTKN